MTGSGVCTIVGMGPGLSQAIAERFGAGGFSIGMVARSAATLERVAGVLAATGVASAGAVADAAQPAELRAALDFIHARLGQPEVLVYNASALRMARPSVLGADELAADLAVNAGGALTAAQSVLSGMRARGRGSILFTGGGSAFVPWVEAASLGAGKAAMRNLAIAFARELAPKGIHAGTVTVCGMIAPGTYYDPRRIAEAFWELHLDPPGAFREEIVYRQG